MFVAGLLWGASALREQRASCAGRWSGWGAPGPRAGANETRSVIIQLTDPVSATGGVAEGVVRAGPCGGALTIRWPEGHPAHGGTTWVVAGRFLGAGGRRPAGALRGGDPRHAHVRLGARLSRTCGALGGDARGARRREAAPARGRTAGTGRARSTLRHARRSLGSAVGRRVAVGGRGRRGDLGWACDRALAQDSPAARACRGGDAAYRAHHGLHVWHRRPDRRGREPRRHSARGPGCAGTHGRIAAVLQLARGRRGTVSGVARRR